MRLNRREFVQLAAAMGASLAWGGRLARPTGWHERRDLYPEGVASGDPDPNSVILWTRRPFESGGRRLLTVEVAEDEAFRRVVAKAPAPVSAADWTTRVLVGTQAGARLLVSLHRWRRKRQPRRPHDHRAAGQRSTAGELRLRQLPERQRRQAQRLSPDDLRRRARAARRTARLRAAPRRFHLRGRPISGRGETRYDRTIYEVAASPRRARPATSTSR